MRSRTGVVYAQPVIDAGWKTLDSEWYLNGTAGQFKDTRNSDQGHVCFRQSHANR